MSESGAYIYGGCADGCIVIYDLNSMNQFGDPTKSLDPSINSSSTNPKTGLIRAFAVSKKIPSVFLVGWGEPFISIYFNYGETFYHNTCFGDMYCLISKKTSPGHTHTVTTGDFSPSDDSIFATASIDGTIRFFNMNSELKGIDQSIPNFKSVCITGSTKQCNITSIMYEPTNGHNIIACSENGLVKEFDTRTQMTRGEVEFINYRFRV